MSSIKELYKSKYKESVIKLFSIIFKNDNKLTNEIISNYIEKDYSDYLIFRILHSYYWKDRKDNNKLEEARIRSKIKSNEINKLLKGLEWRKEKYLDVGCEECYFPIDMGNILGIKDINCVNIRDWESSYNIDKSNMGKCNFRYYNGTDLEYESESISVISSIMVLHHIDPISREKLLNSINRVLEKGGLLIIKEHNSQDGDYKKYVDFIHRYYESILVKDFRWVKKYKTYYMSMRELEIELNKKGFKKLRSKENKYKLDLPYYAIYKKIN